MNIKIYILRFLKFEIDKNIANYYTRNLLMIQGRLFDMIMRQDGPAPTNCFIFQLKDFLFGVKEKIRINRNNNLN